MTRPLIALALVLTLLLGGAWVGKAQTTSPATITLTPEMPLQQVKVGTRTFTVDPFYVFLCYPVHQDTDLGATSDASLVIRYAMQCFIRIDGEMTPIDEFPTDDSGIMAQVEVGQAIISAPQVAQDALDGAPGR